MDDKRVRAYNGAQDYEQLKSWYLKRNQEVMPSQFIPWTGFIVDGVAAGFLYLTQVPIGILDNFISHPDSDPEIRDWALDKITERLVEMAKECGTEMIRCDTEIDSVANRAKKHGFQQTANLKSFFRRI